MTEREVYESLLRELKKVNAPSLHLEDYNYWINKGIHEFIMEKYREFAMNQELTDDLQALTIPTIVNINSLFTPPNTVVYTGNYNGDYSSPLTITDGKRYGSDYVRFPAPRNYWHFLGANVTIKLRKPESCYPAGHYTTAPSKRLTADVANGITNNAYLRPNHERPYHSFANGPLEQPDLMFFLGDKLKYAITQIEIDYLKKPRIVNLTVTQRDLPADTSAEMEFPDYVCREIIKLVVDRRLDPRWRKEE